MPGPLMLAPTLPGGNLIRSFDGITFTTFTPATGPVSFLSLYVVGATMYALDAAGQIWSSVDFGNNWAKLGAAVPTGTPNTNVFFRTPSGTWLVPGTTAGTIQRSTNSAASWTLITIPGVGGADNWFLRHFFAAPGFLSGFSGPVGPALYIGVDDNTDTTKSGTWRSVDDGQTWVKFINTSSGAIQGQQLFRSAMFTAFSSIVQYNPIPGSNPQTQFSYAPSTNPDTNNAQVTKGDAGGAFLVEGTDAIVRSWSSGGDEFHATEANADANTWTAGPLGVANAPSYGCVVLRRDQFFGANIALAHWVVSQDHGTTWTDTGLSVGPGMLSVAVPNIVAQFPHRGSRGNPGEFLAYGGCSHRHFQGA